VSIWDALERLQNTRGNKREREKKKKVDNEMNHKKISK